MSDALESILMRFQLFQRAVVLTCLAAFGIQAGVGAGIVRCTDTLTGASQVEWLCKTAGLSACNQPANSRPLTTDAYAVTGSDTCVDTPVLAALDFPTASQESRVTIERTFNLPPPSFSVALLPPHFLACSAQPCSTFLPAFSYSRSPVLLI